MSEYNLYSFEVTAVIRARNDSEAEIMFRNELNKRNLGRQFKDIYQITKVLHEKDIPETFLERPPISDSHIKSTCRELAQKIRKKEPDSFDMFADEN